MHMILSSLKSLGIQGLAAQQKNKEQEGQCPRGHVRMHPRSRVVQNPFLILARDLRSLRKIPGPRDSWRDLVTGDMSGYWLLVAGLQRLRKT